jgi:hypothetical protein
MLTEIGKLDAVRAVGLPDGAFSGVAPKVVAAWRAHAAVDAPSYWTITHGGAFARRPDCYGVIAMATGKLPTLITLPGLLVAVLIGITAREPAPTTAAMTT